MAGPWRDLAVCEHLSSKKLCGMGYLKPKTQSCLVGEWVMVRQDRLLILPVVG